MSQSQQKWYSSGFDLWVIPFQSHWYSQVDWWSQFFLSKNIDETQFNNGQAYIVDIRRYLPNKKVWIYPPELDPKELIPASEKLALNLKLSSVRVFSHKPCEPPKESETKLKWSIVTDNQQMVN